MLHTIKSSRELRGAAVLCRSEPERKLNSLVSQLRRCSQRRRRNPGRNSLWELIFVGEQMPSRGPTSEGSVTGILKSGDSSRLFKGSV
jgi:hypothetical protein